MGSIKEMIGERLVTKEWLNDDELTDARRAVCNGCPMNDGTICKMCKCVLSVKTRAKTNYNIFHLHLETTHCPMGKWPVRTAEGIGGNDFHIANHYREQQGKARIEGI